jgi:hypothetical protein
MKCPRCELASKLAADNTETPEMEEIASFNEPGSLDFIMTLYQCPQCMKVVAE